MTTTEKLTLLLQANDDFSNVEWKNISFPVWSDEIESYKVIALEGKWYDVIKKLICELRINYYGLNLERLELLGDDNDNQS